MTPPAPRLLRPARQKEKRAARRRAAMWPAPKKSAKRLRSARRKKESRRWYLTVADISTTAASRRWRTQRVKQVWSSKYNGNRNQKKARCRQLPVERPGSGHQPRDQGGQGRQKHVIRGVGRGGRSHCGRGRIRFRQSQGSAAGDRKSVV